MMFKPDKKFVNITSFVLVLLTGFYLLSRLYIMQHRPETISNHNFTYFLVLLIIIFSLIQLIGNFVVREEKNITVSDEINKISLQKDEKEVNETNVEDITDNTKSTSLNSKEIFTRIIPNKLPTIEEYGETILLNLSAEFQIVQGVLYAKNLSENIFSSVSYYAYFSSEKPKDFKEGVTLPGQVAKNKEVLIISNIPDEYIKILSGLGTGNPNYLIFIPVIHNEETIAVIEFASFVNYSESYIGIFKNLGNKISTTLFNYIKKTDTIKND